MTPEEQAVFDEARAAVRTYHNRHEVLLRAWSRRLEQKKIAPLLAAKLQGLAENNGFRFDYRAKWDNQDQVYILTFALFNKRPPVGT